MKKVLTTLLILIFLASFILPVTVASTTLTFTVGSRSGARNSTVTVPITVSGNVGVGFSAVAFVVDWTANASHLTLTDVKAPNSDMPLLNIDGTTFVLTGTSGSQWIPLLNPTAEYTGEDVIVELTFAINASAPIGTEIPIGLDFTPGPSRFGAPSSSSSTNPLDKGVLPTARRIGGSILVQAAATNAVTVVGGSGSGNFAAGDQVSITANTPPAGQQFSNWSVSPTVTFVSGTSATSPNAVFTMPSGAVTATANFEPIPAGFNIITVTSTGSGIANANAQSAPSGTTVTLTATPSAGNEFVRWEIISGTITLSSTTATPATFTMPNTAVAVRAVFQPTGGGGGGGTTPPPPPAGQYQLRVVGAGAGGTQTGNHMPGASVTLSAGTPPTGQTFVNWTISPTTVSLTSPTSATAAQVTMPTAVPTATNNIITVTANWSGGGGGGGGGGGDGDGGISVLSHFGTWTGSGTSTARVDEDHSKFVRLLLNGNVVASSNYTVTAGSTIITLNESYLRNFANGTYNFRAEFTDGFANLRLIVSHNFGVVPQTGIPSITGTVITMWMSIIMTATLGVCLYTYIKAKRKQEKYGSDHEDK